jgi:hypothetical protein
MSPQARDATIKHFSELFVLHAKILRLRELMVYSSEQR